MAIKLVLDLLLLLLRIDRYHHIETADIEMSTVMYCML